MQRRAMTLASSRTWVNRWGMSENASLGRGGSIVLVVLALGAAFCGVHAILSESVTTPAKFGGDHRVYGGDTVLVGVGWILMGAAIAAKVIFARLGRRPASVIGVILAVIGALFWVAPI